MNGAPRRFCTDVARERGEPLAGTGALPERLLLIRWPRGQWRQSRTAEGMGSELIAAMLAVNASSPFGLFVDRVGATESLPRLHAFPENVVLDPQSDAELAQAMHRWAAGEVLEGRPERRITIICCTDSRTDACCAKFGFATYKALVAAADPAVFNIMQCNHLGGCRFATSLAVLPRRERYGRLTPEDVPAFLEAIGRGQIYLAGFRGRADLDEPRQVAEIAALRWAEDAGLAARVVTCSEPAVTGPDQLEIVAAIAGRTLQLRLVAHTFLRHGTCRSLDEAPTPVSRWLVQHLEERRQWRPACA
jgi:hypothetical protein